MNILAYVNDNLSPKEYQCLLKNNVTRIFMDVPNHKNNEEQVARSLKQLLTILSPGDQLIIYDLSSLNRTLSELTQFFKQIREKNVQLTILNKEEIFSGMTDVEFMDFILELNEESQRVAQERRIKSVKNTKRVGRPRLSEASIKEIRHLRIDKQYSLKHTASLCGVSIGTVYKYADACKE